MTNIKIINLMILIIILILLLGQLSENGINCKMEKLILFFFVFLWIHFFRVLLVWLKIVEKSRVS